VSRFLRRVIEALPELFVWLIVVLAAVAFVLPLILFSPGR
jgi:beta-lactamase regulating signal transducer with metallopeptidase domain